VWCVVRGLDVSRTAFASVEDVHDGRICICLIDFRLLLPLDYMCVLITCLPFSLSGIVRHLQVGSSHAAK